VVRLRTHRKGTTRFAAAGTAVTAFLASLAALIGVSVAPAGAGTNGPTTYEADCTTSLAAGTVAPFVLGLDVNGAPEPPLSSTGLVFGVSGEASATLIGPVLAGLEQAVPGGTPTIGVDGWTEAVGSTDGKASGTFSYTSPTFSPVPALGRQITGVSWASGSTTLTASNVLFNAGDVGKFVAGPSGQGINPQSMIVSQNGSTATISVPTTAAPPVPVTIGTGANMTFTDPAFRTGNVFTATGVPGLRSNIGVTSVTRVVVRILVFNVISLPVTFGSAPGVSTNCLLTGWDADGNPGPTQAGALAPALPPGITTPLVLASGGFISQPGTTQMITPPAAGFFPPAARGLHK
jgi:hypothetical protein